MVVQIVGIEEKGPDAGGVHTIDIWFSERRRTWFVECLDADGHQLGAAYLCSSEDEAQACLQDWLRTHTETQLVSPRHASVAEKRLLAGASRRAA